jgi:hypothetical protein
VTPQDLGAPQFAQLAAELLATPGPELTAQTIVDRLRDWADEADDVSLTARTGKQWRTLASTGPIAERADDLQYELDEGPCREAATETSWLRSGDVGRDARWPTWGPRAASLGVGSLLSVPLLGAEGYSGALNLYSEATGAFHDRDVVDLGLVYAIHAANALTVARNTADLTTALTSRHTIGMAQGIVMERYGLDQQQSFELLRRLSSTSNRKLRDVAAAVVETRQLPAPSPSVTLD